MIAFMQVFEQFGQLFLLRLAQNEFFALGPGVYYSKKLSTFLADKLRGKILEVALGVLLKEGCVVVNRELLPNKLQFNSVLVAQLIDLLLLAGKNLDGRSDKRDVGLDPVYFD